MTARTPEASTVPEPFGSPGGPGLFHVKGLQLPPYVQHIAHHLVASGKTESEAIQMALGIVKNWAGGKGGVHPDVRAAAVKAAAEWEAAKAAARVGGGLTSGNRRVTSAARRDEAVELAGEQRYKHGWVLLGGADKKGGGQLPLSPGVRTRVAAKHHIGTQPLAQHKTPPVENLHLNSSEELRRMITGSIRAGDTNRAKVLVAELKRRTALPVYSRAGAPKAANLSREVELNNWANWDANKGGSQQTKDGAGHDAATKAAIASAYKNKADALAAKAAAAKAKKKAPGKKAAVKAKAAKAKRVPAPKKPSKVKALKAKIATAVKPKPPKPVKQPVAKKTAAPKPAKTTVAKPPAHTRAVGSSGKRVTVQHHTTDGREAVELAIPVNLRARARQAAAKRGQAMPDGSFPIRNRAQLVKAKRAVGLAKPSRRGAVKAFISKRAAALGVRKGKK